MGISLSRLLSTTIKVIKLMIHRVLSHATQVHLDSRVSIIIITGELRTQQSDWRNRCWVEKCLFHLTGRPTFSSNLVIR